MHVPLAGQERELLFGKIRIDQGQRDTVKGQVPSGVPGVLPLVGHGDNVGVVEVSPFAVAAGLMTLWRCRFAGIAFEPGAEIVIIKLLGPEHPRKCLPLHPTCVLGEICGSTLGVKLVGFGNALGKYGLKAISQHGSVGPLVR